MSTRRTPRSRDRTGGHSDDLDLSARAGPVSASLARAREARRRLIVAKQFQIEKAHRLIANIGQAIGEFERAAAALDEGIRAEEDRAGIRDLTHFAYPRSAKSMRVRRDNIRRSITELREELARLKTTLANDTEMLAQYLL